MTDEEQAVAVLIGLSAPKCGERVMWKGNRCVVTSTVGGNINGRPVVNIGYDPFRGGEWAVYVSDLIYYAC